MVRALGIAGAGLLATILAASPATASAESAQSRSQGPAERARYLFLLHGIPVGAISLELEKDQYRYRSEHLFTRGHEQSSRTRAASWTVDGFGRDRKTGRVLESLWLWRRPAKPGCVDAIEELGSRRGPLCAAADGERGSLRGTLFGEPFRAKYDGDRLTELRLSDSQFIRIGDRERLQAPPDLFGAGWPIDEAEGTLAIEGAATSRGDLRAPLPSTGAFPSRRELDDRVAEVHAELEPNQEALCTDFVARFVGKSLAAGRAVWVVHGVIAEPGSLRAFPHVWIRARVPEGIVDVDPTLFQPVTPATHAVLAVVAPSAQEPAGRAWLDLFTGRAKVVRRR